VEDITDQYRIPPGGREADPLAKRPRRSGRRTGRRPHHYIVQFIDRSSLRATAVRRTGATVRQSYGGFRSTSCVPRQPRWKSCAR
jgi:hypothetical protein